MCEAPVMHVCVYIYVRACNHVWVKVSEYVCVWPQIGQSLLRDRSGWAFLPNLCVTKLHSNSPPALHLRSMCLIRHLAFPSPSLLVPLPLLLFPLSLSPLTQIPKLSRREIRSLFSMAVWRSSTVPSCGSVIVIEGVPRVTSSMRICVCVCVCLRVKKSHEKEKKKQWMNVLAQHTSQLLCLVTLTLCVKQIVFFRLSILGDNPPLSSLSSPSFLIRRPDEERGSEGVRERVGVGERGGRDDTLDRWDDGRERDEMRDERGRRMEGEREGEKEKA